MKQLKAAIITTSLLIFLLVGYIFVSFDENYEVERALDHYLKGEYGEAQAVLEKLGGQGGDPRYFLYQAYVTRSQSSVGASAAYFEKVLSSSEEEVKLEACLNKALNAYILGDSTALEDSVRECQNLSGGKDSSWTWVFQCLAQPTEEGPPYWELPFSSPPLSSWMKTSFEKVFTTHWALVEKVKQLIATKRYLQAREELEEAREASSDVERDELNFFIGLSYFREAKGKHFNTATPYYKLAFAYFSEIPFHHKKFKPYKSELVEGIEQQIQILIDHEKLEDVSIFQSALEAYRS